jgi:hypothetical protein
MRKKDTVQQSKWAESLTLKIEISASTPVLVTGDHG